MSKRGKNGYVNRFLGFFTARLWKRAVEKPVETVEKLGFSTAKPGISPGGPTGKSLPFPGNRLVENGKQLCYGNENPLSVSCIFC